MGTGRVRAGPKGRGQSKGRARKRQSEDRALEEGEEWGLDLREE